MYGTKPLSGFAAQVQLRRWDLGRAVLATARPSCFVPKLVRPKPSPWSYHAGPTQFVLGRTVLSVMLDRHALGQPTKARSNSELYRYLAVKSDDDDVADVTRCWGVRGLPFPQNRVIKVVDPELGEYAEAYADEVVFVPVPGVPLSQNRYYAVLAAGNHRGLLSARRVSSPVFVAGNLSFVCPFQFLSRMRVHHFFGPKLTWTAYFDLGETLHGAQRSAPLARSLSHAHGHAAATTPTATAATVAVGRWYTPFFLIMEDGVPPKTQMDKATFYEIVLEQRWEAMGGAPPAATKRALVGGSVEVEEEAVAASARTGGDGYLRFSAATWPPGQRVAVHASLWERMVWEEQKGGWVADEDGSVRKRIAGAGVGSRSVLVERFAVRRMDGSVAVAFDFFHVNKIS
uniref:Uncharacterized protein n=1 Tax=Oryza brachyantha TaxID=4533 RepID=J3MSY6_ORYBR